MPQITYEIQRTKKIVSLDVPYASKFSKYMRDKLFDFPFVTWFLFATIDGLTVFSLTCFCL